MELYQLVKVWSRREREGQGVQRIPEAPQLARLFQRSWKSLCLGKFLQRENLPGIKQINTRKERSGRSRKTPFLLPVGKTIHLFFLLIAGEVLFEESISN